MSSIFDSVDTAAARRKNRIMETSSSMNFFSLHEPSVVKNTHNSDKNAFDVQHTSTNMKILTYSHNNEKTNASVKL